MYSTILLAVDGSDHSSRAAQAVGELALKFDFDRHGRPRP